jgi:hypothetical protein
MSGENFYNRQAAQDAKLAATVPTFSPVEAKTPMVNGAPGSDNLPSFATYESGSRSQDDRMPLNQGPPSINRSVSRDDESGRYYGEPPRRSNSGPRDQYGAPVPVSGPGVIPPMPGRSPSGQRGPPPGPYRDGMTPPRGAYGPRGRGGYTPRGRGGYGPRGPPPGAYGRGGYPGRGRGGYPPPGPSRGPDGSAMMAGAVAGGAVGAMAGRAMGAPPPGYGLGPSPDQEPTLPHPPPERENMMSPSIYSQGGESYAAYGHRAQSPGRRPSQGSRGPSPAGGMRAPSPAPAMPPMPSSQVAEMDGQGAPAQA